MFDLKRPCDQCPFRIGNGQKFGLRKQRLLEIFEASAFQCHKTVEYLEDENGNDCANRGDRPQQCAGLMAILFREGKPNQIMQVAERLGSFTPERLDPKNESYASMKEALENHQ